MGQNTSSTGLRCSMPWPSVLAREGSRRPEATVQSRLPLVQVINRSSYRMARLLASVRVARLGRDHRRLQSSDWIRELEKEPKLAYGQPSEAPQLSIACQSELSLPICFALPTRKSNNLLSFITDHRGH